MKNHILHFFRKFTELRNPWVLKEKENIPTWTKEDEMSQDAFLAGEDEKDGRPGRVVIRIRPEKERGILSSDREDDVCSDTVNGCVITGENISHDFYVMREIFHEMYAEWNGWYSG